MTRESYLLASRLRRTVYDSLYLALSEREGCPLVKADEILVNSVAYAMPNVILLSDSPKREAAGAEANQ